MKKEVEIESYSYNSGNLPINIKIARAKGEFVPIYEVSISTISKTTEIILERIRKDLIKQVNLGMVDITSQKEDLVNERFKEAILILIDKYFPDIDAKIKDYLTTYLIQKSLGLGNLEILLSDENLEEIAVNSAAEPVWVFHRKHGWLKTNITLTEEDQVKHYSSIVARKVGRQITILEPLLDAHLSQGERVNATLQPISMHGNTMTFRKFAAEPLTITQFLRNNTLSKEAAALIWLCMQYELSAIIGGGTASGKTSTLNVLATFFPPNQRIVSIEDTAELKLPKFLHWVPMNTRLPNAEGKGEISMEDLLVNSLRMRPDRILVGEIRRQAEAETFFEAIHTGHSCYGTFHANDANEMLNRMLNPPINVPKAMLPAISLILIQFRNRRTGTRRTFQVAEVMPDSSLNIIMQHDTRKDTLVEVSKSKSLIATLKMFSGMSEGEIAADIREKISILVYLVKNDINRVDEVGKVIAEYYTDKDNLMKAVKSNKLLGDKD